jgi:hypothetical protein
MKSLPKVFAPLVFPFWRLVAVPIFVDRSWSIGQEYRSLPRERQTLSIEDGLLERFLTIPFTKFNVLCRANATLSAPNGQRALIDHDSIVSPPNFIMLSRLI